MSQAVSYLQAVTNCNNIGKNINCDLGLLIQQIVYDTGNTAGSATV